MPKLSVSLNHMLTQQSKSSPILTRGEQPKNMKN